MNINQAALLSKKKEAAVGRAAVHQSLKKPDRLCDHYANEAPRIAANIAKLPKLLRLIIAT